MRFKTDSNSTEMQLFQQLRNLLLESDSLCRFGNITIKIENKRIKQKATMRKGVNLPFEVEGPVDAEPEGEIRLHAQIVASAHVSVKDLLHFFGENLAALVNIRKDRGVRVEGDDILIHPSRLLPPPQVDGKISAVRVEDDRIVLTFQSGSASQLNPPYTTDAYIYHRGGVLRFGKLTMADRDL